MNVKGLLFFSLLVSLPIESALGYVRTMSDFGQPLVWSSPSFTAQANPSNSSGLSDSQVQDLLGNAFNAWNAAGAGVSASYSQSRSNSGGANFISFTSNSGKTLGWGVIAVTEVTYFVSSGRISEFNMAFNDRQFQFTANEGDTGRTINGRTAIYLRDVATHEAGHSFGLDHGIVNNSSLIYTAYNGQYSLSDDDKSGIRTIYSNQPSTGSIRGSVVGTNGGIFGAHVEAIRLDSGSVQAGVLSDPSGDFSLGNIPAGQYAIMVEPLGVSSQSLSNFYDNVDHRFCGGGSRFRRGFYSSCGSGGVATVVQVNSSSSTAIGGVSPSCGAISNNGAAPNSIANAKVVNPGAYFGTLNTPDVHYYRVNGFHGKLTARAIAYALFSPVDVKVEILDSSGSTLAGATSVDNIQSPMPGGGTNFDSYAEASNLSGDFLIRVTSNSQRISSSLYSAGYELKDSNGHYLLAIGGNDQFGTSNITDMRACASVNNVTQSSVVRPIPPNLDEQQASTTGCGSLAMDDGGNGPFSAGMVWALSFALLARIMVGYIYRVNMGLVGVRSTKFKLFRFRK